ncbi:hypothetical protein FraQA3DRAFT_0750 [Frankia sp. QA3]|nr:hypothetical protein FraQA3DRAFT_0750 [Frankia sp. QA3]
MPTPATSVAHDQEPCSDQSPWLATRLQEYQGPPDPRRARTYRERTPS